MGSVRPSIHPSIRPSVRPSMSPSVHPYVRQSQFTFSTFMFLRSFASLLLPKCSSDLKYAPAYPHATGVAVYPVQFSMLFNVKFCVFHYFWVSLPCYSIAIFAFFIFLSFFHVIQWEFQI